MHILCTICSDLVNQAESLYVTKCGHIFHHHCLAQWIERSKSCPQCRNKVTEKCMFRMYPTLSNEGSGEDAATLQSRLDDAMLQLRTCRTAEKEVQERLTAITADLSKKDEQLAAAERRLAAREAAAAALREQLLYAREQARGAERLRDDNDRLQKNLHMLNGLQRVLNATAEEVEAALRAHAEPRAQATFAAALKRALCESESKKREWRERQLDTAQQLAAQRARADELQAALSQIQNKLVDMERKYETLKHKRKASGDDGARAAKLPRDASPSPGSPSSRRSPADSPGASPAAAADSFVEQSRLNDAIVSEENLSFGSLVARIEASESPYLALRCGGLALAALRRAPPALAKSASFPRPAGSIFQQRAAVAEAPGAAGAGALRAAPYDGLGGHGAPDVFPTPPPRPAPARLAPRAGGRHKLKKFDPSGSRDIAKMFGKLQDN